MPDPYKYGLVPEAADFLALFHGFRSGLDGGQRNGWNGADLHKVRPRLLLEHVLTVELHHALLRMMSTPLACRFSMVCSLTSKRLPTLRCWLAALPMPSN